MNKRTSFQMLLENIGSLAMYAVSQNSRLPRPDSPCFSAALKEAVVQYLAITLQAVPDFRKTIYGYVNDYYPYTLDASLRKFYRHEETIRIRAEQAVPEGRHLYDPAEFMAIQNRAEQASPLIEAVLRKNAHLPKNLPNTTFAKIYAEYDQEYHAAACLKSDSDYVFASIYFYRLEHALALSLIANIAEYMATNHLKYFAFEKAAPFLTDASVPDIDMPKTHFFCAWPNLLSVYANIPHLFSEDSPSPLIEDFGSRVLKQNILERLPHPAQYGQFDLSEVADFVRRSAPIIESHTPVSFYLDETTKTIDKAKIKLARMLMRQFYSFATEKTIP